MLSRRERIQEKKSTRKGFLLLLLSLILLLTILKFGTGILLKISDRLGRNAATQVPATDKTPPGSPQFDQPIPTFVHEETVHLSGRAEANSRLKIYKNGLVAKEMLIAETSRFSTTINLDKGNNAIWLVSTDESGNESGKSSTYNINLDNDPPFLEITTPSESQEFYGQDKLIDVSGKTDTDAKVTINDRVAIVQTDGSFALKLILTEGDNTLKVVSQDQADNKTEKIIHVTYSP